MVSMQEIQKGDMQTSPTNATVLQNISKMFKDFFWSANSPRLPTWCHSRWTIQFCLPSVFHWSSTQMKPVCSSRLNDSWDKATAYEWTPPTFVATREQTLFAGRMCTVKLLYCANDCEESNLRIRTYTKHTLWCTATEPAAIQQLRPPD